MKRSVTQRGFTLVELLIVIVVVAILAAITIVAYTGVQNRAYDSAVQSDLSNLSQLLNKYFVENGTIPAYNNGTALASLNFKATKAAYITNRNNLYYCPDPNLTSGDYAISGASVSGNGFIYTTKTGSVQSTAAGTGAGGDATCNAVGLPTGTNWTEALGGTTWNAWAH